MTHGSLFSGIGGFDLAAQWMGWENKFHCEWNEFGQRVLHHYWPGAELFTDITKSDFTKYANQIDVLTGGFPCQPYSAAGKRLGKEDERHLWPQMCRAIQEIAPRYVVGENVRGLANWNGGLVFDEVCTDLENLGYQVAPFIIPASAVNAPHQRERVWFVAYCEANRFTQPTRVDQWGKHKQNDGDKIWFAPNTNGTSNDASDADRNGLHQRDGQHEKHPSKTWIHALNDINENDDGRNASETMRERLQGSLSSRKHDGQQWNGSNSTFNEYIYSHGTGIQFENFPTQSPICGGNDGLPSELDGITFPKWRNESIKGYGNAVVPQVVYQIFKAIEQYESKGKGMATVLELF
jgi:DNA (cytosine-5)-methyltransferase 1